MSATAPSLAPWLARDAIGQVYCVRCRRVLWECPSCGDFQCGCALSWLKRLPKKDRFGMPRQHYAKDYKPYVGDPTTGLTFNTEDNSDE